MASHFYRILLDYQPNICTKLQLLDAQHLWNFWEKNRGTRITTQEKQHVGLSCSTWDVNQQMGYQFHQKKECGILIIINQHTIDWTIVGQHTIDA